ncbi:MAG TPA: class I SAM-dependent methyltransferase [bacterium]|nr:class I SAM-dependent methyltransferase [bacterium]
MSTEESISPVKRSRREARETYDKLSAWYDLLAGSSERKYRLAGLDLLDASEGEVLLEIGSGTGDALLKMGETVTDAGRVVGTDISPAMCKEAAKKLQNSHRTQPVNLLCADAVHLPVRDSIFDGIFMSFVLELFDTPDIPRVLDQCHRVLKPGGEIVVVGLDKSQKSGLVVRLYEWAHRQFPSYVDCRPMYVGKSLETAGFLVTHDSQMSMWGLGVAVVRARKSQA